MKIVDSIIVSEKNRSVQDIFFTVLFCLYWIGVFVIAGFSFYYGNLHRLSNAADAEGNICGVMNSHNGTTVDLRTKPFIMYLINQEEEPPAKGTRRFIYGKCVEKCPEEKEILCQNNIPQAADEEGLHAQLQAGICFHAYASVPLANRCVPRNYTKGMFKGAPSSIKSLKYMSRIRHKMYSDINEEDFLTNVANDLYYSWQWIFIACAVAFGLAFIWLLLVQYLSWFMIWGSVVSSFIFLGLLTSYFWALVYHVTLPFEAPPNKLLDTFSQLTPSLANDKVLFALATLGTIVWILYFFAILLTRSRIGLAIYVMKAAGNAASQFPSLFLVPVVKNSFIVCCSIFILFVFLLLASVGEDMANKFSGITNSAIGSTFTPNWMFRGMIFYVLFGYIWTIHLIEACGQFAIATIVAAWYWTPRQERSELSGWISLKRACLFTFLYHFGSLAFGAFVITIIYVIRFLLDRIAKELEAAEQRGTNQYVKYISKVFHIVFGIIEYLVRYLNGKVYIEIALYGYSFLRGVGRIAHIITNNPVRAVVLEGVSVFIFIGAKISITTATSLFGLYFLKHMSDVGGGVFYAFTITMILILSYIIASSFVSVIQVTVDTIFVCFLEECEINPDGPSLFMPTELVKFSDFGKQASSSIREVVIGDGPSSPLKGILATSPLKGHGPKVTHMEKSRNFSGVSLSPISVEKVSNSARSPLSSQRSPLSPPQIPTRKETKK